VSDLVEFLRDRLDEDEQTARAAADENQMPSWELLNGEYVTGIGLSGMHTEGYVDEACGVHIARHDPARVLAEVDAKRRIIDEVASLPHVYIDDRYFSCSQAVESPGDEPGSGCDDDGRAGQPCDCGLARRQTTLLALLALPFANHESWREEWRP